jgi:peptidoglycan/xylan/chitin deacetylase (PgdA/CDA1 family)
MTLAHADTAPASYRFYDLAFRAIRSARMDRIGRSLGSMRGVIFALHRVRPARMDGFQPNFGLEITPEFLDDVIRHTRSRGFIFVSLDEALQRLNSKDNGLFAVLTMDDGYRDSVEYALPVLEMHQVPATLYVTSGFADGTTAIWWVILEHAIGHMRSMIMPDTNGYRGFATDTSRKKLETFRDAYERISDLSPTCIEPLIEAIARQADLDIAHLAHLTCLDWNDIKSLSRHPLITIGAHTDHHPVLSRCDPAEALIEMSRSRARIEEHIEKPVRHFAYPHGNRIHAGPREFSMAKTLGFASAMTTRPGLIYDSHRDWTTALPRVSLNGYFQSIELLDIMLSGVPFLLRNLGSRLNIS